jgi:hypothetical protein
VLRCQDPISRESSRGGGLWAYSPHHLAWVAHGNHKPM